MILELLVHLNKILYHFKDLDKLKLLTNFDVKLASFLGEFEVISYVFKRFIHDSPWWRRQIDIKICQEIKFMEIFKVRE